MIRRAFIVICYLLSITLISGCLSTPNEVDSATERLSEVKEKSHINPLPFSSINMLDNEHGWASAYQTNLLLYLTKDGGKHWRLISLPPGSTQPIYILDTENAWVANEIGKQKSIFYTRDGGETWIKSTRFRSDSDPMFSLFFMDSQHGWMTGQIRGEGQVGNIIDIMKTIDGGATWTPLAGETDISSEGFKGSAVFTSIKNGWISAGKSGFPLLYASNNGGIDWHKEELNIPGMMPSDIVSEPSNPIFFNPKEGIVPTQIYLNSQTVHIVFFNTMDAGITWKPFTSMQVPRNEDYSLLYDFLDVNTGFIILNGKTLFKSKGQLDQWEKLYSFESILETQNDRILSFDFINATSGWVLVGKLNQAFLYKTNDGGKTWRQETAVID